MRKIMLSSFGLLGLAAAALPAPGGEARSLAADPSFVQTAPAAVEQGIAATDESAASRRRNRRTRRGGGGGNGGRQ
jgi:hypothetical protein